MATTTERRSTVVGVFEDHRQAETAVRELCESGLREDQIRVEEARYFHSDVVTSRISVTIEADGRSEEDETILRRHGAVDVHTAAAPGAIPAPNGAPAAAAPAAAASSAPAPRTGEGARIQLHEEELHAHTQFVETGEVRVRKEVVTEHRTIEVPVQREEVVIERHAPTGEPDSTLDLGPGEVIRIPVRKERVIVEKWPVVKEEVTVGKRVVRDLEQVGDEVRKEKVRVEREGAVDVHTAAAPGMTPAPSGAPAAVAPAAPVPRTGEAAERIQLSDAQAAPEKSLGVMGKEDEEAQILHRAYLKWLGEGCPEGQDRRHYFEAAREVRG